MTCSMSINHQRFNDLPEIVRDDLPIPSPSSTPHRPSGVHLVVHFDINETILLGDEAGGDTREDALNKMLAKSAFVRMPTMTRSKDPANHNSDESASYEQTSEVVPTLWWNGELVDDDDTAAASANTPPALYTKWNWPTGCCPYYRTSYKKRSKTFVEHHGKIYKQFYEAAKQKLSLQHLHETHPVLPHVLPAFWETLQELSQRPPDSSSLTVVLRTMGSDLHDIAAAISLFAQGQHPDYPNFSNLAFVLTPQQLYRGQWTREPPHVYQLWQNNVLVASGDSQVVALIQSHTICGIQDDYPFWKRHNYEPWSGKPVWIPYHADNGNAVQRHHHVLLDDNIHNLPHDGIASVRKQDCHGNWITLKGAELLEQHGTHLIRTPTIEPVLNPKWFVERLDAAVFAR